MKIFLDDVRETPEGYERTYTVKETIEWIIKAQTEDFKIEVLSLDNDLGEGLEEGYKVLDWLEEKAFGELFFIIPMDIKIHSANPVARRRMQSVIDRLYNK